MAAEEVPVPAQYVPQPVTDFRGFEDGPRGYKVGITKKGVLGQKRRLEEYEAQVAIEQETLDTSDVVVVAAPKRVKHNTIGVGKGSGRSWKAVGERAGSLRNPKLSTSWEKKMQDKAEKAAFDAQKREARDAWKAEKAERRARREATLARKEENRKQSEITVRVSTQTAKRMQKNKKQRKALRTGQ